MGLIDRDYMHERGGKDPRYNPRDFRSASNNGEHSNRASGRASRSGGRILFGLAVVAVVVWVVERGFWPALVNSHAAEYAPQSAAAQLFFKPAAFPRSGSARYYQAVDPRLLVSSVTVDVQAGSHRFMHVLRIVSVATQQPFVDIYLLPSEHVEFGLPAGSYVAQAFVGDVWLGKERLFGPDNPPMMLPNGIRSQTGGRYDISLGTPMPIAGGR